MKIGPCGCEYLLFNTIDTKTKREFKAPILTRPIREPQIPVNVDGSVWCGTHHWVRLTDEQHETLVRHFFVERRP